MPTLRFRALTARLTPNEVRQRAVHAPGIIALGVLLALTAVPFGIAGAVRAQPSAPNPEDEAAIRALVDHVVASWPDGDAIAALFTEETAFIVGDGTYLTSPAEIVAYFASFNAPLDHSDDAFSTSLRGTSVTAEVQSIRFLTDDVAVGLTKGGILLPGETAVPPERLGLQTFVVVKRDGTWLAASYQNTRIESQP